MDLRTNDLNFTLYRLEFCIVIFEHDDVHCPFSKLMIQILVLVYILQDCANPSRSPTMRSLRCIFVLNTQHSEFWVFHKKIQFYLFVISHNPYKEKISFIMFSLITTRRTRESDRWKRLACFVGFCFVCFTDFVAVPRRIQT